MVVVACAISAGVHVALAPAHFADGTAAGVGFLAAATFLALLAVLLTRRQAGAPTIVAAVAVLAGLLASWALAVSTGVPVLHPDPESVGGLALVTKTIEVAGLLAGALLLRRARPASRPIPLALATLIAVFSALTALAVSGGHDMHVGG